MARLLASKPDEQLFGQTEFELRDRVHQMGVQELEAAADERQKKGRIRGCWLLIDLQSGTVRENPSRLRRWLPCRVVDLEPTGRYAATRLSTISSFYGSR